jgi:hypothetical protein
MASIREVAKLVHQNAVNNGWWAKSRLWVLLKTLNARKKLGLPVSDHEFDGAQIQLEITEVANEIAAKLALIH